MAFLICNDPAVSQKKIALSDDIVTLGRHPECQVIIEAGAVSRKHARIQREGDVYTITDLGSRNGTIVNRTPISSPTRLFDGAEISICDVNFVFQLSDDVHQKPRTTVSAQERRKLQASSFLLEDDNEDGSTILGQMEIPSHHTAFDTIRGAEEKLKAIITVTQALKDAADAQSILACVIDSLFQLFVESDRGFVALKEPASDRVVPFLMKTRRGVDDENVRLSRTIINTVMASQQAILSSDAAADSRFDMSQSLADFRIRSMMAAPLVNAAGESIGVIQIDSLRPSMAFSQSDLEVLATVTMQASLALQKFELYREAAETRRIEQDLQLAQEVQLRFLPEKPPSLNGYRFFSFYKATSHVGGDYFDYIELDEHRCAIIVADVVGHGVAAALLMAKIAAESRFALAMESDPVAAVNRINNAMSGMNVDRFITFLLFLIDDRDHIARIVNAGHMAPIIRHPDGRMEVMGDDKSGLPVGIVSDYQYDLAELEMKPGISVLLYTDGVNEAMNAEGEELTLDRVVQDIKASQAKSPEAIGRVVCDAIRLHVGDAAQTDDICMVCVGRQAE